MEDAADTAGHANITLDATTLELHGQQQAVDSLTFVATSMAMDNSQQQAQQITLDADTINIDGGSANNNKRQRFFITPGIVSTSVSP